MRHARAGQAQLEQALAGGDPGAIGGAGGGGGGCCCCLHRHPPERACITKTRLSAPSGSASAVAVVAAAAVDERHHVGAQVALVVEQVATQARIDREHVLERTAQRVRGRLDLRHVEKAPQLRSERDAGHAAKRLLRLSQRRAGRPARAGSLARAVDRNARDGFAAARAMFIGARDEARCAGRTALRQPGRSNAQPPSSRDAVAGRRLRPRTDRPPASACSRVRFRRRGSHPRPSPLRRARSTINEMLPFEHGAIRKRFFNRASPGAVSGHASSRCQARFRSIRAASSRPLHSEVTQHDIQVAAVQPIELAERQAAAAHLVHGRLVLRPPGIGERQAIDIGLHGCQCSTAPRGRSTCASRPACRRHRRSGHRRHAASDQPVDWERRL